MKRHCYRSLFSCEFCKTSHNTYWRPLQNNVHRALPFQRYIKFWKRAANKETNVKYSVSNINKLESPFYYRSFFFSHFRLKLDSGEAAKSSSCNKPLLSPCSTSHNSNVLYRTVGKLSTHRERNVGCRNL